MTRSRFNEEQIIAILKEQEAGMATAELCRRHGISGIHPVSTAAVSPVAAAGSCQQSRKAWMPSSARA